MTTSPREFQEILEGLLLEAAGATGAEDFNSPPELQNARIRTFEREEVLTREAGLTVMLADGSKFQITIVSAG
jgi:hypothetical protein